MLPVEQESWAAVTSKGQVTIPKSVRDKLGVTHGGKIRFRVRYDGTIIVERPTAPESVIGRLQKYAADKPADAYDYREQMIDDRRKELGY